MSWCLERRTSLQPGTPMLAADPRLFRSSSPEQLHNYLHSRRRQSDHCTRTDEHLHTASRTLLSRMLPKQPFTQQRRSQPSLWPAHQILGGTSRQPRSSCKCAANSGVLVLLGGGKTPHYYSPRSSDNCSPVSGRRVAPSEKRILKRCPQSDLGSRFQCYSGGNARVVELAGITAFQLNEQSSMPGSLFGGERVSNESTPSRTIEEPEIDPVYLALKQATGKYGGGNSNGGSRSGSRRGSSAHNFPLPQDYATPSPKNLSQVSLQDSGYAEPSGSRPNLLLQGSTPHLDTLSRQPNSNGFSASQSSGPVALVNANRNTSGNNTRRPKLSEKMKSLSLDCAEMPPPVTASVSTMRSPFKSKPICSARGFAASGESLNWERSVSPTVPIQPVNRRLPLPAANGTHVVIHEYVTNSIETALFLGDRLHIVDNGDPDWLHGFKVNDRLEQLLTFPATCVTAIQPGEQPMKLIQNCNPEKKVRLYRDQVVFAQPDSIREDSTILIRNEHRTFVYCPLQYLMLI